MPWDGTELMMGHWDYGGTVITAQPIAGGKEESIFQPEWSPEGVLHFVSDRTGWWNLYRWRKGHVESLLEANADFGLPQWVFGMSTYSFLDDHNLICAFIERGLPQLGLLNTNFHTFQRIKSEFSKFDSVKAYNHRAVFIAGSHLEPNAVVSLNTNTSEFKVLRSSNDIAIDPWIISLPRPIEFPTADGLTAHAFYYPPRNPAYREPAGEKPPLIVEIHGGPTAATYPVFSLWTQFWTTRGFAVLDVNYGGSTGYGREYRQRLKDQWGIVDVNDCVNGAKYLVEKGLADPNRLCITGGSAGGYTVLCALTFHDVFKAGASHYGVSDLQALDDDTHKFESRYTFNLVPKKAYKARSPIYHTDQLNVPVIFFQGMEDKIVPPNQAEKMVNALRKKGLPVAYVTFAEEGHGFRHGLLNPFLEILLVNEQGDYALKFQQKSTLFQTGVERLSHLLQAGFLLLPVVLSLALVALQIGRAHRSPDQVSAVRVVGHAALLGFVRFRLRSTLHGVARIIVRPRIPWRSIGV